MLSMMDSRPETSFFDPSAPPTVEGHADPIYPDEEAGTERESRSTNETRQDDGKRRQKSLGITDLLNLHARNRVAADPAGWTFAAMEWWTTWLLLQENGRVWEDDLRGVYDGSLFFRIREARRRMGEGGGAIDVEGQLKTQVVIEAGMKAREAEKENLNVQADKNEPGWNTNKGYGWRDWMRGIWKFGNWRVWEVEGRRAGEASKRGGGLEEGDPSKGHGVAGNVTHGEL